MEKIQALALGAQRVMLDADDEARLEGFFEAAWWSGRDPETAVPEAVVGRDLEGVAKQAEDHLWAKSRQVDVPIGLRRNRDAAQHVPNLLQLVIHKQLSILVFGRLGLAFQLRLMPRQGLPEDAVFADEKLDCHSNPHGDQFDAAAVHPQLVKRAQIFLQRHCPLRRDEVMPFAPRRFVLANDQVVPQR